MLVRLPRRIEVPGNGLLVLNPSTSKSVQQGHRAVVQTHAWRNEFDYLAYPYHEEENPGYLRVSAVFAGAHVIRAFLREAKSVSNGRKADDLGVSERGLKPPIPPDRNLLSTAPAVLQLLCSSKRHIRGA